MAVIQENYNVNPAIGVNGLIANTELANIVSREVESDVGIAFGQPAYRGVGDSGVVVGGSFAATAVGTHKSSNTGNSRFSSTAPTATLGAKVGRYVITIIKEVANKGEFFVEDPDGVTIGTGEIQTAFSGGGIGFTIQNGTTDSPVGDQYYVDVTHTTNGEFIGLSVMSPAVKADATSPDMYVKDFVGAFMTLGTMYVTSGDAVTSGSNVYWNPTTKKFTTSNSHIPIPDAVFDSSASAADEIVTVALKLR